MGKNCSIYLITFGLAASLLLSSAATWPRAAAQSGGSIELAVDTANFNQDGLLVLFGGLRLQGDIGLPVAAGDLNGDGRADVIFCGMNGSTFPMINNGVVNFYMSDGRDSGFVDAGLNPPNIFTLTGQRTGDLLGTSVSANGDVNGDGLRDVAVAAALNDGPNNDRFNAGAAYIVYGSHNLGQNLSLATSDGNPPPGVTAIYGPQVNGRMGIWIDEGDVDGDGFADVIIGSDQINSAAGTHVGGAYIVFGAPSLPPVIDLASPPPGVRTTTIIGRRMEEHWGAALHIGDINNDGIGDLVIGGSIFRDSASYVSPNDSSGHDNRGASDGGLRPRCGEVYVLYGSHNWPALIDLSSPPANATHVIGANSGDLLGSQLHSGDINGDGRTDLIMGALQATAPDGRGNTGAVYVVYGSPGIVGATIDLADPQASGLRITSIYGEQALDCAGDSVRSYDINRDGMFDLFIGSPENTFDIGSEEREDAGDTKVIFGRAGFLPEVIKLYDPPPGLQIFRLAGAHGEDQGVLGGDEFSYRLCGADVDGDGYTDYIANAMHGDGFADRVANGGNVYIFSGKKLSERLGQLAADRAPAPSLTSAQLTDSNGGALSQAPAGQRGLRVSVNGTGFRTDTEIQINGISVVTLAPTQQQLSTQRVVRLDDNPTVLNSVGLLTVRARNMQPAPSDFSNELSAGQLLGPAITEVRAKRKASGLLILKISGANFPLDGHIDVSANGQSVPLKGGSVQASDFAQVKIRSNAVPPSGAVIHVRISTSGGIESNDATVTSP
ncbi:MAG TPA: hypothetical protein VKM94_10575 [Blastocatellia bacterium]|nr:hypothetical protein [Blastocatellia bacterium]